MDIPGNLFKQCVQVGVVVRDLDAKVAALMRLFGIGPFHIIDYPAVERGPMLKQYHGQPGQFTARIASANLGTVDLELIEPAQGPSIWHDFLAQHGEGIHHIKFTLSDDVPILEHLAQNGVQVEMGGVYTQTGNSFCYLDTQDTIGFCIELMRVVASPEDNSKPMSSTIQAAASRSI